MTALWGGRFKKEISEILKEFSYSLEVDGELLEAELRVNDAWVKMLAKAELVTKAESSKLARGLKAIEKDLKGADWSWLADKYEDVHSLIQSKLEDKVGKVAKKLHTGRSRNDLVVTSTRLYLKSKIDTVDEKITKFQKALVALAKDAGGSVISGMTHLRRAQPVLIAHHLLAYVEMAEEDKVRLEAAKEHMDVLPLGSAALAGSSLEIDQKYLAKQLGFSKVATNSMAAVSDRGFLVELLSALSILWMHLSRLSEDFILWNSEPFQFIELDDAYATGSSLMPQKKNPDVFELIRGRSAVIFGHLQTELILQKGLPLAYNRDLQEDKPPVFDALHKTEMALELLAGTIETLELKPKAMEVTVLDDDLYATDVLEYLVRKGVPFYEAHEIVGNSIRHAVEKKKPLRELSMDEWREFSKKVDSDVYQLFDPQASVGAKKTIGSTNPSRVKQEIQRWERSL